MNEGASIEMPRYRCHKEVWALKIAEVTVPTGSGGVELVFEDSRYAPLYLPRTWEERHRPMAGGYYVVYKDGYTSYSPAEAFEDGYTKV